MFGHNDDNIQEGTTPADHFGPSVGGTAPANDTASPAFTASAPGAPDVAEPATAPDPVDVTAASAVSADEPSASSAPTTDSLIDIKQQALQQLSPLVGHLEQSPEEKFRTTMMMIQASDNQSLIKDAYAAAQAIGDEKVRAQALLDIVNEINYFTQHHNS